MKEFPAPESERRAAVNLFENFDEAFSAVMSVEKAIASGQRADSVAHMIRAQMFRAAEIVREKLAEAADERKERFMKERHSGFQGVDGFNRYEVYGDGTITLSERHSLTPCLDKARELGIKIHKY